MKQTRQAVCAVKQSIFLRCLWLFHCIKIFAGVSGWSQHERPGVNVVKLYLFVTDSGAK